ncbi:MAG: histidine phosphatase family protein [Olegusella sp.]|nr:histidine phosphatase family protein [Olegusella sp.]
MKRVTFYYVRHGRTEFNRDGIIQGGRVDSPLAEESIWQVEDTGRALAGVDFAHCYTSPLGRARQTAEIVLAGRNVPIIPLDDLCEFDFGTIDGKPHQRYGARFAWCYLRQDFSSVGGETGAQVRARVRRAFQTMYDESADGENVLVTAHGALMRYVLLEFYRTLGPVRRKIKSETLKTPNAGIAVVTGDDTGFDLVRLPMTAEEFLRT